MKTNKPTRIIKGHQPCISCSSSDAMNIHEGGDAFCWSCNKAFTRQQVEEGGVDLDESSIATMTVKKPKLPDPEEIHNYRSIELKNRKISKAVCEFFGFKVGSNGDGKVDRHFYPNSAGGYKIRYTKDKKFAATGDTSGIYGIDKFAPGGRRLVITTGELDMASVAEASLNRYGKIYPVITAGSDQYTDRLLEHREWIRSFEEVVIMFDQDESGQKAQEKAIKIVGMDKAKVCVFTEKDPNALLLKQGWEALMSTIFNAQPYVPGGIMTRDALWNALVEYNSIESIPFPACLQGPQQKTKGKRYGEISLFISGTGSGKSTLLREDALNTLETTEDKIGWLAFEEGPAESARKFAGMALQRNPANELLTLDDLKPGFDRVFGDDRVMVLDHQGSMSDESVIDKLEYMCLAGCRHIYIDHITILVSEGVEGLHGNEAQDKIMNDLLRLVKRYPVWIGLVSHLRKTTNEKGNTSFEQGRLPSLDDIKGSGSIKQISMDIIAFARNMTDEDEMVRNTIKMSVLKCRFTGLTGPVSGARYNFETGRLNPIDEAEEAEFHTEEE